MFHPLNKKGDFKKVFEHGRKFSSKYLLVYTSPNGLTYSRLGLSVNRRLGNAVVRNRLKRRLREVLRKHLMDNFLQYDFVVVARKDSAKAGFTDLNNNISKIFSGLVNENNFNSDNKTI